MREKEKIFEMAAKSMDCYAVVDTNVIVAALLSKKNDAVRQFGVEILKKYE